MRNENYQRPNQDAGNKTELIAYHSQLEPALKVLEKNIPLVATFFSAYDWTMDLNL